MAHTGTGRPAGARLPAGPGTRLAITASTVASSSTSEWYALRTAATSDSGVRPSPLTTGTTTLPNSVASRALKASSRGISSRPSVGPVGEVAADHHDRGAEPLDLAIALDDPGDQLLPLAVGHQRTGLGGGHPVGVRIRRHHRITLGQQGEQGIVDMAGDQRPEDADPRDLPGEQLDQPERDGAFADARAEPGHIDASCHALNLPVVDDPRGAGRRDRSAPGQVTAGQSSSSSSSRASQVANRSIGVSNSGFMSTNVRSCSPSHSSVTVSSPRRSTSSSMPRSVKYMILGS